MASQLNGVEVAVIGAGIVGIAVAYYLVVKHGVRNVALIDPRDPMSLTSAQSGENYRNWWPDAVMRRLTDDSIGLLEDVVRETGNRINMTRRGYALVTRRGEPADLLQGLYDAYGDAKDFVRVHSGPGPHSSYRVSSSDWTSAPDGFDVIKDRDLIRNVFPAYAKDVETVVHVRRGGSISGQQLGQFMLERIRDAGGVLIRGNVVSIEIGPKFILKIDAGGETKALSGEKIVNAAGPLVRDVARLVGEDVPVSNVYQQKISFEDHLGIVPRDLPFTIDLDGPTLLWTDEERELLQSDPATVKFTKPMVGGIHCRPDGPESGKWIKLGWAYNSNASDPHDPEPIDPQFPDLVLRAASRLQPGLASYIGRLPRQSHHYGGYYTMTEENWPLIGPMKTPGAFMAAALSGFGTMAATMCGSICADWVVDRPTAPYADALTTKRYEDNGLMGNFSDGASRGLL